MSNRRKKKTHKPKQHNQSSGVDGSLNIGAPFGDKQWSTPGARIDRATKGGRKLTRAERYRMFHDPKEATMPEIVGFIAFAGVAIGGLVLFLSWVF